MLDKAMLTLAISALVLTATLKLRRGRSRNGEKRSDELQITSPNKAHGVIFGKQKNKVVFSPTDSEGAIGVFSASGTGKTSAVAIPTLRSWSGTSFTIDISGDICSNCPDMLNKLIYAPEEPATAPYNVFGAIDALDSQDDKNESLEQLAFLLMPEMPGMNENARFFHSNGRKILTASLIAFYHQGLDFIQICEKIVGSSCNDLFWAISDTGNTDAILYINSFKDASEQNNAGCKQSCDDAIKLFATNARVKRSLHRPGDQEPALTPEKIESNNIFIIVPDPKLELYAPLMNIITSQMMQYISSRRVTPDSKQILLCLDEFASLRLDSGIVMDALRKYRKRRCRVMILMQNLADMDIIYGKEQTRAILANLRFKILLGGLGEPESQLYFADLIGHREKKKTSVSHSAKAVTRTESQEKEYIIAPADLDKQGKDTVILVHPGGTGYMILGKNYYFKK